MLAPALALDDAPMLELAHGQAVMVNPADTPSPRSPLLVERHLGLVRSTFRIAATACASELPLSTRSPADFASLEGLVDVVAV